MDNRKLIITVGVMLALAAGIWLVVTQLRTSPPAPPSGVPVNAAQQRDAFIAQINIGNAHLENHNASKAIDAFDQALAIRPDSAVALRNVARAYRMVRLHEQALAAINRAVQLEPESPAGWYLKGLAHTDTDAWSAAAEAFAEAVRLDAHTAALRYQLGRAYDAIDRRDAAREQWLATVRIDPTHAAAHLKLAQDAAVRGEAEHADRHRKAFERWQRMLGEAAFEPAFLEQCEHTRPEAAPEMSEARVERRRVEVSFVDASDAFFGDASRAAVGVQVVEHDREGRYALLAISRDGAMRLLTTWADGPVIATDVDGALQSVGPRARLVVGNFHDDVPEQEEYDPRFHARNDVLVITDGRAFLLKRTGEASFADVTADAGLPDVAVAGAAWVDYDHDGDVDLALAGPSGLTLWRNNGDGTFTDATESAQLASTGDALDVVAGDLQRDIAVDLVTVRGGAGTLVDENKHLGRYQRMPEPPGPWPAARHVVLDDIDNDGRLDAALCDGRGVTIMYGNSQRHRIDLDNATATLLRLVDYDNDGHLDVLVALEAGGLRLWRNVGGEQPWQDVTQQTGLEAINLPPVREIVAFDADSDEDTDLLVLDDNGRLHLLRNDGGHVNGQVKVRLVGKKTNPMGLGAQITLRAGVFRVTRNVSAVPIELGLGGHETLDSLQTLWTNGVIDNQIVVAVRDKPATIVEWTRTVFEQNVATGSCPFLYVWDGERFRFVTDLLGNAPVGLPLSRETLLPAKPSEYVLVGDSGSVQPRNGAYELKITDEFREVLYLDEAKFVAVDHPADVEIHSTDKIEFPPFAPSALWALGHHRSPGRVTRDTGEDVTDVVTAIDGRFTEPGTPLPPPLRGMCRPLALTMDFGAIDTSRPLVLALTGWLQYGDASANINMSQNPGLEIIPPMLEAQLPDGSWRKVEAVVGMPAGKTKTILVDLAGRLPDGTRKLRLTTTFELRWDRVALFERVALDDAAVTYADADYADLHWRGVSELAFRDSGHPATPDHDVVFQQPPWETTLEGWCTRYGDVRELITETDGMQVIMNCGDALLLRFDADGFVPVPPDMKRTYFFYSYGWDKDADHNIVDGQTVAPLPVEGPDNGWRERYNTRWVPFRRFDRDAPAAAIEPAAPTGR